MCQFCDEMVDFEDAYDDFDHEGVLYESLEMFDELFGPNRNLPVRSESVNIELSSNVFEPQGKSK